jgi:hypothetical protein
MKERQDYGGLERLGWGYIKRMTLYLNQCFIVVLPHIEISFVDALKVT